MDDRPIVVMVAVPSEKDGQIIARDLVEKRLAACVQALSMSSTYRWEGEIESASEFLLLIKTRAGLVSAIEAAVIALHPYDVPEIIAVPTEAVFGPYRDWLMAQTQ
jgi:periplasmic divalent cation tolerance protein